MDTIGVEDKFAEPKTSRGLTKIFDLTLEYFTKRAKELYEGTVKLQG
jgi:hypothetical protein